MVTGRHAPPLTGDQFIQEAARLHALGWYIQSWEMAGPAHWRIRRVLPLRPNSDRQLALPLAPGAPASLPASARVCRPSLRPSAPLRLRVKKSRAAHWFQQMRLAAA